MPDLFVGRAPVNDPVSAAFFVEKTLAYEREIPDDYTGSVLMLGASAGSSGDGMGARNKTEIGEDFIPAGIEALYLCAPKDGATWSCDSELTRTSALAVIDAGETVELDLGIANSGGRWAQNVKARLYLEAPSPYITVVDGSERFGDIPAGAEATPLDDFDIQVNTRCPAGYRIEISIEARSLPVVSVKPFPHSYPLCVISLRKHPLHSGSSSVRPSQSLSRPSAQLPSPRLSIAAGLTSGSVSSQSAPFGQSSVGPLCPSPSTS